MLQAAAISIDVDSLRFYREIHGLGAGTLDDDPIYSVAMPRFFELIGELGAPATVFAIAADAEQRPEAFAPLAATGSELASHSFAHDYRLTRRSMEEVRDDLTRARDSLARLAPGGRVVGFRAPGYNVDAVVLSVAAELGCTYDSSLLPSPHYFLARAAAIVRYRALGRPSASLVGRLRDWLGPLDPYPMEPAAPHRVTAGGPLIELPIAVEPLTRVPLIGTSWALLPGAVRERLLTRALGRLRVFNFELHAIDLLDPSDPGVPRALVEAQPDLRIPARVKVAGLRGLLRRLLDEAPVRTLAALADAERAAPRG